ncbi:MAG: hypothetical protein GX992_00575 [Clostridium sp.]|nr:hypothetical protein [Clostridium sp.]
MAFTFYMSMEKLSLKIANEFSLQMTNDNFADDLFLDLEKTLNNIQNGFIVITQLNCFLESFLNTIILSCMEYDGNELLTRNIKTKMEIIFFWFGQKTSLIIGTHLWQTHKTITKVRNAMIHFKKSYIGEGGDIPDFCIANEKVSSFFTRMNMVSAIEHYKKLACEIATILGLKIFEDIEILGGDGTDDILTYVYNPKDKK